MRRNPWIRAGVIFALFLGATCAGYRALPYPVRQKITLEGDEPWNEMRFDRARWIAKTPAKGDPLAMVRPMRGLMTTDVIANVLRPGITGYGVTPGRMNST